MVVNSMAEISSFVEKFVNLWKRGCDVSLNLETHAGQASVSLRLGLDNFVNNDVNNLDIAQKKKVSPSRLRRRERRASARRLAATINAGKSETEASEQDSHAVITPVSSQKMESQSNIVSNSNKSEDVWEPQCIDEKSTEKVEYTADSEYDLYVFSYWDNLKVSKIHEASSVIENRLKDCFKKNMVKHEDQAVSICDVQQHEENEVRVLVKLKKNVLKLEHSARNCQTFKPNDPAQISLKTIIR